MRAVNAAKLRSMCVVGCIIKDSLGGGSRVGLDVDTPDLGVEVEGLQGSLSAEVFEDINVLCISDQSCKVVLRPTSLPP